MFVFMRQSLTVYFSLALNSRPSCLSLLKAEITDVNPLVGMWVIFHSSLLQGALLEIWLCVHAHVGPIRKYRCLWVGFLGDRMSMSLKLLDIGKLLSKIMVLNYTPSNTQQECLLLSLPAIHIFKLYNVFQSGWGKIAYNYGFKHSHP